MWECGLKLIPKGSPEVPAMSLLMWECGLKLDTASYCSLSIGVTPYVGVWIETGMTNLTFGIPIVTPYVGVWIETLSYRQRLQRNFVTPYVGVWIETL